MAAVETGRPVSQSPVLVQLGGSYEGSYLLPLASGLGKYRRTPLKRGCRWQPKLVTKGVALAWLTALAPIAPGVWEVL